LPYLFIIFVVFIHASYEGKCLWLRGYCAYSTRVWCRKRSKEYSKKSNDDDDDDDDYKSINNHDDDDDDDGGDYYKSINYHHDDDDDDYKIINYIMMMTIFIYIFIMA
jgi:hypothetical protein